MDQPTLPEFNPSGRGINDDHFIGLPFTEKNAQVISLSVPLDVTTSCSPGTSGGPNKILLLPLN